MPNKYSFLTTEEIGEAIKECKPEHIAVAYVGRDWTNLITPNTLKKIILSPTIGSNPYAIKELANRIGWDNVLFLDNLHAKMYIGKNCILLGSANLSSNGLAINGLEEAMMYTNDKAIHEKAKSYFDELTEKALEQYPDEADKKKNCLI